MPENLQLKKEMFSKLDLYADAQTILATNTSELSVTAIASSTKRPEKVIGMHWDEKPVRAFMIIIKKRTLWFADNLYWSRHGDRNDY